MSTPSLQSAAPLSKRSVERHLDHLPVLSNVAVQLMALDTRDPKYFDRVKRLIECEPAFVVRILSAANSARSAPRLPITTLNAALIRVGSTHAANLVLAAALSQVFVPQRDWQRGLWRHAIQVAVTGRALSSACRDKAIVLLNHPKARGGPERDEAWVFDSLASMLVANGDAAFVEEHARNAGHERKA